MFNSSLPTTSNCVSEIHLLEKSVKAASSQSQQRRNTKTMQAAASRSNRKWSRTQIICRRNAQYGRTFEQMTKVAAALLRVSVLDYNHVEMRAAAVAATATFANDEMFIKPIYLCSIIPL